MVPRRAGEAKMTEAQQIADFIARRGVTRVAQGERTVSSRDMYAKVRGELTDNELIAQRRVTVGANGREYVTNGLGERIA